MKKIIIAIMAFSMPIFINAQSSGLFSKKKIKTEQDITAYLAGAVPTENEKVVFDATIDAPGKSKADIMTLMTAWANLRFTANNARGEWTDKDFFKNNEYAQISSVDKSSCSIVCRGAEDMIFSNKALAKDYTEIYYRLDLTAKDGSISFKMSNIAYVYVGGSDAPQRVTAEEWITDAEAINKKGELRRISGKFRVKTIDLKNELIRELSEAVK